MVDDLLLRFLGEHIKIHPIDKDIIGDLIVDLKQHHAIRCVVGQALSVQPYLYRGAVLKGQRLAVGDAIDDNDRGGIGGHFGAIRSGELFFGFFSCNGDFHVGVFGIPQGFIGDINEGGVDAGFPSEPHADGFAVLFHQESIDLGIAAQVFGDGAAHCFFAAAARHQQKGEGKQQEPCSFLHAGNPPPVCRLWPSPFINDLSGKSVTYFPEKIFIGGSDFFPRDDGAGPAAGAAVPAGREGNPGDKLSLLVRHHFDHTVAAGFGAGTTVDTREIGGDLDHGVFLLG